MSGIEAANEWHGWDFIRIAYNALINSMISHMIKVLDTHRDAASFCYIYKCKEKEIESIFTPKTGGTRHIFELSGKLKHIRDKTHFHIDRDAVFDPSKVWEEAKITVDEIRAVMLHLIDVLHRLHIEHFGSEFSIPEYNGDDAYRIVKLAAEKGIIG